MELMRQDKDDRKIGITELVNKKNKAGEKESERLTQHSQACSFSLPLMQNIFMY